MNRPRKVNRHLPPCVYEKHGAFWHVKAGKWTRLGSNLHAALARYAEQFEQPTGTIDGMIDNAMRHILVNVRPNTARQYRVAAKKLKKYLIEFRPEQVRPKHVYGIKRALEQKQHMANTVLSVGKLIFGLWLEDEIVDVNPFAMVPRYRPKGRDRLPSRDEYDAVYAKADEEMQIIMELWRGTGQRVVDVLRISRADADLDAEGIRFKQQKTGKKRVVRWTPELRAAVTRAKALYGNLAGMYLLHKRGRPVVYETIRARFQAACKAAGVTDLQMRDFRAMAATEAERQGLNATALLGHDDARTTRIYLRNKQEKLVDGPSFRPSIAVLDKPSKKA